MITEPFAYMLWIIIGGCILSLIYNIFVWALTRNDHLEEDETSLLPSTESSPA
jgi:hypothetical protein